MNADLLKEVRGELLDVLEECGQLAGFLREAIGDMELGNAAGANVVAGDALESLDSLQSQVANMGAKVAKWMHVLKGGEA